MYTKTEGRESDNCIQLRQNDPAAISCDYGDKSSAYIQGR
jgi:hypothetical protein